MHTLFGIVLVLWWELEEVLMMIWRRMGRIRCEEVLWIFKQDRAQLRKKGGWKWDREQAWKTVTYMKVSAWVDQTKTQINGSSSPITGLIVCVWPPGLTLSQKSAAIGPNISASANVATSFDRVRNQSQQASNCQGEDGQGMHDLLQSWCSDESGRSVKENCRKM